MKRWFLTFLLCYNEFMHKRINCFISRAKRALRFIIFVGLALTICFSSSVARALTEEELDRYAAYGIRFYNPSCTGGSVDGSEITYIGDSLSESVHDTMKNALKGIDGESKTYDGTVYNLIQVSKQFSGNSSGPNHDGITIATKLKEKKELRKYLIFALGTNGPGGVTDSVIGDLAKAVGDSTKVLLVTNYGTKEENKSGYEKNNKAMKDYASSHSNFAVADWNSTAASDPKKYIDNSDGLGVHLTNDGKKAFANLLQDTVSSVWGGGGKGTSGSSTNKNYAGAKVFSDDDFKKINEYKSVYEAAANKYGFKWQIMAVIHSQEHELQISNPSNGQGIYQLYTYTDGGKNEKAFKSTGGKDVSMDEFAKQTDLAASIVADMAKSLGADMMTDQGAKEVLYQYNGKATQYYNKAIAMGFSKEEASQGDGSAYVMNRFDARRDPTSSEMDPLWPGYFTSDNHYTEGVTHTRMGTFVKYAAIGGTGEDGCKEDNDFASYVKRYAWPDKKKPIYLERMPDYVEAIEAQPAALWGQQDFGVPGIDCHAFVTTIINNSGVDPDYSRQSGGVKSGALAYLKANKDKWELVNSSWGTPLEDESKLTPGDIALSGCDPSSAYSGCGHTYVYAGEIEGFETHIASASTGKSLSRAPAAGGEAIKGDDVMWFHRK